MLIHFLDPVVQIEERLFVEQVKHQDDAVSTFVVCVGYSAVSLLTSSVPNLKLNFLTIVAKGPKSKINTDG